LTKNSYIILKKVRDILDRRFPNTKVRVRTPTIIIPFGTDASETTEVVPADCARAHVLRNNVRVFIEIDTLKESSIELLSNQLKIYSSKRDDLNSPHIPRWAYEKAKLNIEKGETDYIVDEMIDTE
jgi:hypothetical protein